MPAPYRSYWMVRACAWEKRRLSPALALTLNSTANLSEPKGVAPPPLRPSVIRYQVKIPIYGLKHTPTGYEPASGRARNPQ